MAPTLRVFIVRHGETEANKDGMIQGQLDTPLNEEGLRQAGLLAQRLKGIPMRVAYTSDLSRAKKTAESVLEHHKGVVLNETRDLRERFMGALQGCTLPPIARKAVMQSDKTIETTEQLGARVVSWWKTSILPLAQEHLRNSSLTNGDAEDDSEKGVLNVLATSHGGAISTFFNFALAQGLVRLADGVRFTRCWNTSVSVVEVDCETLKGEVVMYGDISHLLSKAVESNADEVDSAPFDTVAEIMNGVESRDSSGSGSADGVYSAAVNVVWREEAQDSRPQSRNV